MEKRKVIITKNLPGRYPLQLTVIVYLVLDKFNADGWVWGVCGAFMFILWLAAIFDNATSEKVDIFKDKQ
jgi:hypothetical protein